MLHMFYDFLLDLLFFCISDVDNYVPNYFMSLEASFGGSNTPLIGFFYNFFPEIFIVWSIIILLLFSIFYKRYTSSPNLVNFNIYISLICLLFVFVLLYNQYFGLTFYFDFAFVNNKWIAYSKMFSVFLVFVLFMLSIDNFKFEKAQLFEYPIIVLLSLLGMFLLMSANDFFVLYLAVEFQSFCFYILAASKRYSNLAIEASLRYFILGSFSSAILLFGVSLLFGFLGTINFNQVNILIFSLDFYDNGLIFAFVFISIGILFKLGIVPFHFWLPDVYEGSPTLITAFFSIVTKFPFLVVFIKVYFFAFLKLAIISHNLWLFLALVSISYGTIMSLYQVKIKRMLAYSAISHMGFMLMSLSLFSIEGLQAFLLYFIIYVMLVINIFAILVSFRRIYYFSEIRNLVEFSVLFRSNFFLAIVVSLNLLSMAGVPPFSGFFGKFFVFQCLISSDNYFLALSVMLLSVLSSVYYIS